MNANTGLFIYMLKLLPVYQKKANWTEETVQIVNDHFNHLKSHMDKGVVIMAGRTAYEIDSQENFGIVVFRSDSEDSARQFMESDPAILKEVMAATLHPFSLAILAK